MCMGDHGIFFSAERRAVVFAAIEIAHAWTLGSVAKQRGCCVVIERMSGVVLHWTLETARSDHRSAPWGMAGDLDSILRSE